jgi:hypothetical protein
MRYRVKWTIDIDETEARDACHAAELARQIQQDPNSIATQFVVTNTESGEVTTLDLSAPVNHRISQLSWDDRYTPKLRCPGCGRWLAERIGGLEEHAEDCSFFPL